MNYQQTLDWLFAQLPMYQRIGKAAFKPNLDNTDYLMQILGNPESKFKSIHVAGTNGKGSVSHMLASVFQTAGYKTGLYTSPHLKDFRERIKINGSLIPEENVVDFVEHNQTAFTERGLSFFEMTVGLAFDYFVKEQVDIAIIEVGMGGRLDSTNVIHPELSVITNISLDHSAFLGTDLESIAKEKAGIIKNNIPVIIGEQTEETAPVFKEKAAEQNAPIFFAEDYTFELPESDLKGNYQRKNIATVITAIKQLEKQNHSLRQHIYSGLKNVVKNTGLRGRWETLNHQPLTICDTGHNIAGISSLLKQIKEQDYTKLHIVWGMVDDKDSSSILSLLPTDAQYYFCRPNVPRGKKADDLRSEAIAYHLNGECYPSVTMAYTIAREQAEKDDLIFIGGSTFVVAEVI